MSSEQMAELEEVLVRAFTKVLTDMGPEKVMQLDWVSWWREKDENGRYIIA